MVNLTRAVEFDAFKYHISLDHKMIHKVVFNCYTALLVHLYVRMKLQRHRLLNPVNKSESLPGSCRPFGRGRLLCEISRNA